MQTSKSSNSFRKSGFSAWYMFCYDSIIFIGWFFIFCNIIYLFYLYGYNALSMIYHELGFYINWLHILVLFDLFHAPFGLWGPSDIPMAKRMWCKVGRRTEFFITLLLVPEVYNYKILGIVFITWTLSDICRYPFYALSSIGLKPYIIVWFRYSIFIPQYPLVLYSESYITFSSIPYLLQRGYIPIEVLNYNFVLINYAPLALYHCLSNIKKFYPHYNVLLNNRRKQLDKFKYIFNKSN